MPSCLSILLGTVGFCIVITCFYSLNVSDNSSIKQVVFFTKKKVLIFGATKYFNVPMFDEDLIKKECSESISSYCSYTTNATRRYEADAWLYHNRDYSEKLMKERNNQAVHVMFTQESPTNEVIRFGPEMINWTMSYRRDSDIFFPYGILEPAFFKSSMNNDTIWNMKSSNLTAGWMVSNCMTVNKRKELINKAQENGLAVDIYGGCSNKVIPNCDRKSNKRYTCAVDVLKQYYFYFSFENSNCVDYVTEKFFNALLYFYAVPIVIKRKIYEDRGLPSKSFIALDDFRTMKEMVTFLKELKQDKKKYLSYHEWRNHYVVKVRSDDIWICALCSRLRGPILQRKSYANLNRWFNNNACDNSYAYNYLI